MVCRMDKIEALDWAKALIEANPDNLKDPDKYLVHLASTYDLAEVVVGGIFSHYPGIPLVGEEVSAASGLHDIGRPLNKDQTFHELRGARHIEHEGLEKGVASSLRDVYRIAQMIRPHGFAYELWQDPECAGGREVFEPLETALLVPRTWQEAIVTYSDLASFNGERITVEKRMDELLERYENDPKYQAGAVVRAATAARNRVLELAERVEALEQGKLTEQDIARYGFL